jgi:hypothetical protein
MFHRLNDKGDNSLTEIPGFPEKRDTLKKQKQKQRYINQLFVRHSVNLTDNR